MTDARCNSQKILWISSLQESILKVGLETAFEAYSTDRKHYATSLTYV